MMLFHGRLNTKTQDVRYRRRRCCGQLRQTIHLFFGKMFQYVPFNHRLAGGFSNAEPDSDEILSAQVIDYRNKPFVSGMPSARFQTDRLKRQIQIIMCNNNILKSDTEVVRQSPDCNTAQIHECLRFRKNNTIAVDLSLADMGIEKGLIDRYIPFKRQLIQDQKTRVVPAQPVLLPRISQSYD